jgi:hypothetical protein
MLLPFIFLLQNILSVLDTIVIYLDLFVICLLVHDLHPFHSSVLRSLFMYIMSVVTKMLLVRFD